MRNAGLDEAQARIKVAGKNINNLRYADDTTLRAESKELKSLLMKVKEESEKVVLNLNIHKTKIMASGPIISWQINGETMETVTDLIFLGSKITPLFLPGKSQIRGAGQATVNRVEKSQTQLKQLSVHTRRYNLHSSLCFIQPSILHDVLCI